MVNELVRANFRGVMSHLTHYAFFVPTVMSAVISPDSSNPPLVDRLVENLQF